MRKALDFRALLLLILVGFSNGRFNISEFQDVDRFQSNAQTFEQWGLISIRINLQYF